MKFERSDVKFPLWRKKVDSSLFNKAHTPIPNWCAESWHIKELFGTNTSRKDPNAAVQIKFEKKIYEAWITYSFNKDTDYQIFLSKEFVQRLKDCFIMSYMRSLELKLRKGLSQYDNVDIEEEMPFWEFLDIEFDHMQKVLLCKAHYYQRSIFPELFKQFVRSHLLKDIENMLLNKGDFRFIKEDWLPRSELQTFLERNNIIYYLLDTENKLIYIGESEHTKRIKPNRKEIPGWDFFRVDCLPEWLSRDQRLQLERLVIRSFASVMKNSKNIKSMYLSEYTLTNKRIDN